MSLNNLHDVLVDTIKDLYHAEKQLVRALPKLAKAASSDDLREAIKGHLEETEGQVERLEQIFTELKLPAKTKVCHGMMGLLEEGKEVLEHQKKGDASAVDAALIAGAQKVEHYEIAAYGSARTFAETLGLDRVAKLLQQTLDEESAANEKLTSLAEGSINQAAADAAESEGDEYEEEEETVSGGRSGRSSRRR